MGVWTEVAAGVVIQAKSDGFVLAHSIGEDSNTIKTYTDSSNPPTTVRCNENVHSGGAYGLTSCTMPVRKGDYWKVDGSKIIVYWISLN